MNCLKLPVLVLILISGIISAAYSQSTIPIRETTDYPEGALFSASVTLTDGRVMAWGGQKQEKPPGSNKTWLLNTSYFYDHETELWTQGPDLNKEVISPVVITLPDGKILSIGGQGYVTIATLDSFPQRVDYVEMYDPATNLWTEVDSIPFGDSPYTGTSAVVLPDSNVWLTSTNGDYGVFNTKTLTWTDQTGTLGPLDAGGRPMVILDNGMVFCTGAGGQYYDYPNGNITYLDPIVPMYTTAVHKLNDGRILTWDNAFSFSQEAIMVSATGSSSAVTDSLVAPFQASKGILMPDGTIWAMGVGQFGQAPYTLLQMFDPVTDTWSSPGGYDFLPALLTGFKLHLLPDTSILVFSSADGATSYRINDGNATALAPELRLLNWSIQYDQSLAVLTLSSGADYKAATFRLLNLQGQAVIQESHVQSEFRTSLSQLATGIYIVLLEGEDGTWKRKKILVE